jgi:hypothetical protein
MFGRYTTDDNYIVGTRDPTKGFFASAAAGTLPSVSFMTPTSLMFRPAMTMARLPILQTGSA